MARKKKTVLKRRKLKMFQTIIDLYDVFRTDVDIGEEFEGDDTALDTDPAHYLSHDGFYL